MRRKVLRKKLIQSEEILKKTNLMGEKF